VNTITIHVAGKDGTQFDWNDHVSRELVTQGKVIVRVSNTLSLHYAPSRYARPTRKAPRTRWFLFRCHDRMAPIVVRDKAAGRKEERVP
jgi:hypothetical protein